MDLLIIEDFLLFKDEQVIDKDLYKMEFDKD